jgi:uncharacterized damage-inducible protein DinB
MAINSVIADHIKEVYEGNSWTDVSIAGTIKDISFEEAVIHTPASPNTIASIVYHIKFYNEIILQRLNGIAPAINDANGFDMPALKNENDWNKLKNKTHRSFIELAEAAENFPEEKLFEISPTGVSSYYKNLHGIVEHAHYHLGQIVILRNFIRSKC